MPCTSQQLLKAVRSWKNSTDIFQMDVRTVKTGLEWNFNQTATIWSKFSTKNKIICPPGRRAVSDLTPVIAEHCLLVLKLKTLRPPSQKKMVVFGSVYRQNDLGRVMERSGSGLRSGDLRQKENHCGGKITDRAEHKRATANSNQEIRSIATRE